MYNRLQTNFMTSQDLHFIKKKKEKNNFFGRSCKNEEKKRYILEGLKQHNFLLINFIQRTCS